MEKPNSLQIDTFISYMRDVARCEQSMRELNQLWRMIEASAKMNCAAEAHTILPTIAATRAGFNQLENELVSNLGREKILNVLDEIGTKAQYVIDIVVRNLYERTADIGFLATDRVLCEFVAGLQGEDDAIRNRLRAYRNKYTVYDEIILLDVQGNVLVHIDDGHELARSFDPLIAQSLASDGYVETFRATDLRPGKRQALIYSRRMLHPADGSVVGVLCLCFSFEEEMAGIFHAHRDPRARSNMLLLDGADRVIASGDELWIPVGSRVPVNRDACPELIMHGGRAYLVRTVAAAGYQGYMGPPGWQGQVMIPVDVAFNPVRIDALATLDAAMAEGLLSHAGTFCPQLQQIMVSAEIAAETIRRVVWNGKVMTASREDDLSRLKTVLDQISETGSGSNKLFSQSIRELYETVLASNLNNSEFVSHLLVDLLDRNLYERADDCRWWALIPELQSTLAATAPDAQAIAHIEKILNYINQLYTVYTRIFVYDRSGKIVASSNAASGDGSVVGTFIDQATLERVRALPNEQGYHVTPFEPSPLYDNASTYVYHAAIRRPENSAAVVGGIGIVFDGTREFAAMLQGGIGSKENIKGYFIDRSARIISSADPAHEIGSVLEIDADLLALPNGASVSRIVIHEGQYAIMGCTVSNGYREFKNADGYREDVLAVVFHLLGPVCEKVVVEQQVEALSDTHLKLVGGQQFATFFIDGSLLSLPARHAVEATSASEISSISMGSRRESIGVLQRPDQDGSGGCGFVWVFDLGYLIRGVPTAIDNNSQVIVVQHQEKKIGLLVTGLHSLLEFSEAHLAPNPLMGEAGGMLVSQVIKAQGGRVLIQVVDVDYLFNVLRQPDVRAAIAADAAPVVNDSAYG